MEPRSFKNEFKDVDPTKIKSFVMIVPRRVVTTHINILFLLSVALVGGGAYLVSQGSTVSIVLGGLVWAASYSFFANASSLVGYRKTCDKTIQKTAAEYLSGTNKDLSRQVDEALSELTDKDNK